jgi:hypothetical protein
MAEGVGPEFNSKYCKKEKKRMNLQIMQLIFTKIEATISTFRQGWSPEI